MQLKELFRDDDAVSPVIGVILMVAITVILAAVIASFVLGLGSTADEVQPNTSFDIDYEAGDDGDILTITVSSGDSIDPDQIWLRGDLVDDSNGAKSVDATLTALEEGDDDSEIPDDLDDAGDDVSFIPEDADEFSSGQGIEIDGDDDTDGFRMSEHDFSIVWDTGDDSATIGSSSGPDA